MLSIAMFFAGIALIVAGARNTIPEWIPTRDRKDVITLGAIITVAGFMVTFRGWL